MTTPARTALLFVATLGAAACTSAADELPGDPGYVTGPCLQNACFEGYVCLSELCVDPDDDDDDDDDDGDDDDDDGGATGPAGSGEAGAAAADHGAAGGAVASATDGSATSPDDDGTDAADSNDGDDDSASADEAASLTNDDGGDEGGPAVECDVFAQDCPNGEKCNPYATDGGGSWDGTMCVDVDASPAGIGDDCTVVGSGTSGFDDCALGAMCWNVDVETNHGTCIELCSGSQASPTCETPGTVCVINNDGVLPLCALACDPILQDCGGNEGCYPSGDTFVCAPDASGASGSYGSGCAFINVCDPGLFCASSAAVPGCASTGCCSEFCDTTDPVVCSGAAGGQECVAWYEEGQAPPGFEHIGACSIPE
ncbi:MAG TPA: ribulose phosphate epimerase [Nannocystaceae bacterium]|nr:ribulose phosphate epimerase [Nannocystaceae bacterium]